MEWDFGWRYDLGQRERERSHWVPGLARGQAKRSELFEERMEEGVGSVGDCGIGEDAVEPWLK